MSWTRVVRLYCEEEKCVEVIDTNVGRVVNARAVAKKCGWSRVEGRDICQRCTSYRARMEIAYPRVRAGTPPKREG